MKQIEQLYMLHKQDVYHYLLSLTRDPTLSEDLLSETFISAIRSISSFKGQSSVKTWLCSIARHKWLDSMKKIKPTVEYNDFLNLYVATSVENNYITSELANRIQMLIDEKDERTSVIIRMRIEGYSFSEVAEKLGISESSARVIDFRAKKWLKGMLDKEGLT